MRISGLELIEIRLPLREPFTASFGSRSHRRILLLRVEGCEREEGWGECVAGEDPSYSYETTETAWHILNRFILPALLGREIQGPEELAAVSAAVRGHPMAKAAVEMAVWDLQAKEIGVPLWELLGGSGAPIPVGVSVGIQPDDDALVRKADEYLARGYARVKLKIKPGRDVDTVRAVRERFPGRSAERGRKRCLYPCRCLAPERAGRFRSPNGGAAPGIPGLCGSRAVARTPGYSDLPRRVHTV